VPVKIFHNPRCSKSREALGLLQARGVTPQIIAYLQTPPSRGELQQILKALGIPAKDLVRKKEAAEAQIDPEALSEADLVSAMVAHPEIIERPIVVNGTAAIVGRPPERVLDIL